MQKNIQQYNVTRDSPVRTVLETINRNRDGIALVVDEDGRLCGTLTDGDIRRYLLKNGSLDGPCSEAITQHPITARVGMSRDDLVVLFKQFRIRQLPILDENERVCDLVNMQDILPDDGDTTPTVVIMAGGQGKRLRPLTDRVPKPMLEIGDRPILERIVGNLHDCGVRRIFISVNSRKSFTESIDTWLSLFSY